jgi:hypothetical protein
MARLFDRVSSCWGRQSVPEHGLFHGLRSYAVDGVVWSLPDTPENCDAFGKPSNDNVNGPWPQLRAVCLIARTPT